MKNLKSLLIAGCAVGALCAVPGVGQAHSYDTDDSDYPLRYIVYPIHAYGKALEYTITRPIHAAVSHPKARYIFGHASNPRTDDYWGDCSLYNRYSY